MRGKTPAFVALAAAYAVALQAILLAVCGSMAEGRAAGAMTLCAPLPGGERYPAPSGHGRGVDDACLAACLSCCCGLAATPVQGTAQAELRGRAQRISTPATFAGTVAPRTDRAHRSRGPPLA